MNILLIGNGFDLAHGLPTKYTDFLNFCERVNYIYNIHNDKNENNFVKWYLKNWDINIQIKRLLLKLYKSRIEEVIFDGRNKKTIITTKNSALDEFYKLNKFDIWIKFFFQHRKNGYKKENWIDFESEIANIIQVLDEAQRLINVEQKKELKKLVNSKSKGYIINELIKASNIGKKYRNVVDLELINMFIRGDLSLLIRALEIYLSEFVSKIKIQELDIIKKIHPDHVLSFNYTNTYEKYYGKGKQIEYDYIHGRADINNDVDTNNMILGIDEYLSDDRVNKDVEFITFKKFYQRIHKETGCKYRDWVDEIRDSITESEEKLRNRFPKQIPFERFITKHYLYIFGHSLDVSDKDVLRDLILNDNVYTTIYYYNKEVHGQQIANLVKVIGKDELIRRTGGNTKTIEFKWQMDVEDRKS